MPTTPYRPEAKENNWTDSYSQVGSVVAKNTVIYDENGNFPAEVVDSPELRVRMKELLEQVLLFFEHEIEEN